MKRLQRANGVFYLFVFFNICRTDAQSPADQVKAVFVYNFTHFVKWPDEVFAQITSPFIIGVVGKNSSPYLEKVVEGESVGQHPIEIRYVSGPKEMVNCHLLFFEKSTASPMKRIPEEIKSRPILTVSDDDLFMEADGMIRLYTANNKIRLQINTTLTNKSKLELSAKLLDLATSYRQH